MSAEYSWHEFTIRVPVDNELLADHDGEQKPPPNKVDEWEGRDLFDAAYEGLVDTGEVQIVDYTTVSGPLEDQR